MKTEDIIGGVSPLKARQASRGGKSAGRATRTSKQRGGFSKSRGKRGAGGANVGGYNVNTSFTPGAAWTPPPSGGTTYIPNTAQKIIGDPFATKKWTDPTKDSTSTEKTEKPRGRYQDAYDALEDKDGGKYNKRNEKTYTTYEEFEADAKQFNKDNPDYKEYDTKTVTKKGKPGYWTYYDEDGGEISKDEYSKYKNKQ